MHCRLQLLFVTYQTSLDVGLKWYGDTFPATNSWCSNRHISSWWCFGRFSREESESKAQSIAKKRATFDSALPNRDEISRNTLTTTWRYFATTNAWHFRRRGFARESRPGRNGIRKNIRLRVEPNCHIAIFPLPPLFPRLIDYRSWLFLQRMQTE